MSSRRRWIRALTPEERALIEAHLERYPPTVKPEAPPRTEVRSAPSLRRLARQGKVPVDRELDLHGYTVEHAWAVVSATLDTAQRQGWRYLRIITGKGLHAQEGSRRLVDEIPRRLRADPRVAEVVQAQRARDGGAGAWFVRVA